ncbi:YesL family protein [Gracilibacillus saliphilus]|uniref:YesL family protein n=1 Tax=Gracilibacillus saliphilus TaxID=543890 RepID=UPI0013D251C7|nr:YesL family protein [Gracilibacillus saliphilus]
MNQNGLITKLYTAMEWITRIAYVNILWILFTVFGLLLFGVAPATASMFTITRQWLKGNSDISVFKTFWRAYKIHFVQANLLLWPIALLAYMLYINYQYLFLVPPSVYYLMLFIFATLTLIFLILLFYIFPVLVHFEHNTFNYYKIALLTGVSNPFLTVTMFVTTLLIGLLTERIPGILPFFPMCLSSLITMHLALLAFKKLQKKSINRPIRKSQSARLKT